jgi:hypothetical protein
VVPDLADKVAVVAAAAVAVAAAAVVGDDGDDDAVVAVAVAVVARTRVWSAEQAYLPDWWKQNCTARKVYTRSAMAV